MGRTEMLARDAADCATPGACQDYHVYSGWHVCMALFLAALALSVVVFTQERYQSRLGWLTALVLFMCSHNVASCFEVAVIHTLQNPRYVTVQVFFTILAQFLAFGLSSNLP